MLRSFPSTEDALAPALAPHALALRDAGEAVRGGQMGSGANLTTARVCTRSLVTSAATLASAVVRAAVAGGRLGKEGSAGALLVPLLPLLVLVLVLAVTGSAVTVVSTCSSLNVQLHG